MAQADLNPKKMKVQELKAELERRGLTPRNSGRWHPVRVFRVLEAAA